MSDMPKCRLCGAEPETADVMGKAWCSNGGCPLYGPWLNHDQWRLLHGGLAEEHREALRILLHSSVELKDYEREALRAVVGEVGPTLDEYGRTVPVMKRAEMGDGTQNKAGVRHEPAGAV